MECLVIYGVFCLILTILLLSVGIFGEISDIIKRISDYIKSVHSVTIAPIDSGLEELCQNCNQPLIMTDKYNKCVKYRCKVCNCNITIYNMVD